MSEASKATLAWRELKREEGYQPVTVWIPGRVKEAAVRLAFEQHRDLGAIVADALQAYVLAKGAKPSALVDMRRIESLMDEKIAQALATQPAPVVPVPLPPPAVQPEPLPHPPVGMKQCKKGHAPYAASKKVCSQCVREREQRSRDNRAKKRRGEVPA